MSDRRQGTAASPEGLARWMAYLGTTDCSCPHEYKGLGRLYGVSFGKGWVRMDTDPRCPHHGEQQRDPISRDDVAQVIHQRTEEGTQ